MKECAVCGKMFKLKVWNQMYCTSDCKRVADNVRRRKPVPVGQIRCRTCGRKFTPRNIWHTTYCSTECNTDYHNNSNTSRRRRRNYAYKTKFGITIEQYEEMEKAQDYRCKMCGKHVSDNGGKTLAVDHCHDTYLVRGLLCHNCNIGIGALGDDLNKLKQAVAYLEAAQQLKEK